ncbi:uncharacterized protein [Argopecten irradians]|uniref:uncharacterized protein n=1 Tax=Argopecten irradians TaxID=31199 RepID=UPI00371DF4A5
MYNMTGMVASNIFIIRCTENGQWQAANFFCKYRKNDLEKFCPSDHQYEDTTGTCYKTHQDPKTRDEAEQYCASQNKHLLNADVPAKRWAATWQQFIFPESVGQVLLDGRHDGNGWYNWAGQVLSYKEKLDPSPQPGSDCVLLTLDNFSLEAVSCSKIFNFSCHFELCPETAGYSLSNYDVCYKMRPERQFDEVVCMENVTRPELREFYNSSMMEYNYFKGVNFLQNKNDYQYRNLFPIHGKYAFYYENVTASYWAAHERTCRTKGLVVGNMATEGKKRRFLHILGDRASTVLVATKLDTSTYQWAPKEGLDIDLTLTPTTDNSQRDTYVNKCVRLDARNRNYRLKPINCETTLMYLCAEMIGTDAHDLQLFTTVSSYNKAQEQCQNAGKTLVQIYSKSLNSVLDFLIKENVSTHTWIYVYTGHYLVKRDYVYRHMTAPVGTVKEQALNFRSNYTNDTKDANQQVIYYTDTDSFDLAKFNVENFHFVCQTSQLAMWQSPGPDDDTAYIAVRHKQTYTPVVSRKNTLPYACSIDTNSLIRSLVLPRM